MDSDAISKPERIDSDLRSMMTNHDECGEIRLPLSKPKNGRPVRKSKASQPSSTPQKTATTSSRPPFPFAAIVAQDAMKTALILAAIDPSLGGVLIFGDRGTGKSTAIRALAALLPKMRVVAGCPYSCEPGKASGSCPHCASGSKLTLRKQADGVVPIPVIDLPLGATEDRVVGALDLERALVHGEKAFQPGLLARAHRGFLYIDEVNLLDDHLVDVLLDVAASGENVVEREGLSLRHPARFVLVGSGNPEEGELRPQLLDRFGLSVDVETPKDIETRIEVVKRRDAYDQNPVGYSQTWKAKEAKIRTKILAARERVRDLSTSDMALRRAAELCIALGTDGLRGELTLIRAARALAAYEGASDVAESHVRSVASMALQHRLRRSPLDDSRASVRVQRAIESVFGSSPSGP